MFDCLNIFNCRSNVFLFSVKSQNALPILQFECYLNILHQVLYINSYEGIIMWKGASILVRSRKPFSLITKQRELYTLLLG